MQNSSTNQNFSSLKLHILELLYSSIINKTYDNAVEYIVKIILNSDTIFHKLQGEYSLISKCLIAATNCFLLYKNSSTFGEYVLNFIKIDTIKGDLLSGNPSDSVVNRRILYSLISFEYLLPIVMELITKIFKILKNFQSLSQSIIFKNRFVTSLSRIIPKLITTLKWCKAILDLGYKLKYILDGDFLYFDVISHFFNIMTVNKGSTGVVSEKFLHLGRQLNLFFLFMFVRLGEWYYKKESNNEIGVEIEAPGKINSLEIKESICPICKSLMNNHSIIAVKCCGTVYCENCIRKEVEESGKCFVCANFIEDEDLVKIFK